MALNTWWKIANVTMTGAEVAWPVPDKTVTLCIAFTTAAGAARDIGLVGFETGAEYFLVDAPITFNEERDFANDTLYLTADNTDVCTIIYKVHS